MPEESTGLRGLSNPTQDLLLDYMIRKGMKITPLGYLEFNYPDGIPGDIVLAEALPPELLAQVSADMDQSGA